MTIAAIIGLAALLTAPDTAQAPAVDVTVTLEPPVIPYHRQARLTVAVEAPAGLDVELPDAGKIAGGLTLVGPLSAPEEQALRDGRRRIATSYTLDAVWVGDYPMQPVTVSFGEGGSATVPGPVLRVRELTEEETEAAMQFAPNAGPMDPRLDVLRAWWFWAIVGVAGTVLCVVSVLYARKRMRTSAIAPPLPPWEVAYERLRVLDEKRLPESGGIEDYYVELSAILRHYIEDRFHLHAPEETTPEFLAEAARSGALSQIHQDLLAKFLRHSDRVKFARYQPTLTEMESSMAQVLRFVDETIPAPEEERGAAA